MEDRGSLTGEPERSRRGRPRDPGVDQAILTAAVDLLAEGGYARLTMEQVAARAGVGKASVYLRWPNKVALVAEAIQHRSAVVPKFQIPAACPRTCACSCGHYCGVSRRRAARSPRCPVRSPAPRSCARPGGAAWRGPCGRACA